ncbi:MAG: hypothetical protein IKR74_00420 [Bacilli bacterium]|nr:hypothetical protein [Bacilli bacterium]
MENENKLENMDQVQTENSALQGPISLPETDSAGSGPVIEIDSPSVDPTPMVEVQPVETPAVEPTPEVVEATIPTSVEEVQPAIETPVVESTPTIETPAVEAAVVAPEAPAVMEEPAASNVEQLETLAPPTVDSTDAFQAQSVPNQPEPTPAPALDPSLNVQQIAPALDEIAAENAPKKKSKKGLIFILLLIVAIIAGVVIYKFVLLKPNKAYDQIFNVYKEKVSKALKTTIEPIESSILETGNITIETNVTELKDFNNLAVDYRFGLDYPNKKIELTTGLKESSKDVLKATMYLVNNKIYLLSEQIYSKPLLIGNSFNMDEIFENIKPSDLSYAIKSVGNCFVNALANADYTSQDTKIKIGDKSTLVTDNIMVINEKNLDKILKSFYKEIKNDHKLVDIISTASKVDVDQINSYIDSYLNESHDFSKGEIRVHTYTKLFTSKVVSIKASVNSNGESQDILDITFDKKNITINVIFDSDNKITAKSTDGKNFDIIFYSYEEEVFNGKITKNSENNYSLETKVDDYTIKATFEYKEENSDRIIKSNIEISEGSEYLKISIDSKTQYNMELGDVNVSGAVDINNLSSTDIKKIEKNIKKVVKNSKALSSLFAAFGIDDLFEDSSSSNKSLTEMCDDIDTICSKCTGNSCECVYNQGLSDQKTITCPKKANTY